MIDENNPGDSDQPTDNAPAAPAEPISPPGSVDAVQAPERTSDRPSDVTPSKDLVLTRYTALARYWRSSAPQIAALLKANTASLMPGLGSIAAIIAKTTTPIRLPGFRLPEIVAPAFAQKGLLHNVMAVMPPDVVRRNSTMFIPDLSKRSDVLAIEQALRNYNALALPSTRMPAYLATNAIARNWQLQLPNVVEFSRTQSALTNHLWSLHQLHSQAGFFGAAMAPMMKFSLQRVFQDWRDLARFGMATGAYGLTAYLAALETRNSVLTEEKPRPAVRSFTRRWLGFRRVPETLVDAVIEALLEPGWDDRAPEISELPAILRARVKQLHRGFRPIEETEINGRRIASLHQRIGRHPVTGDVTMLIDTVPDSTAVDDLAIGHTWNDPRLERIFAQLKPDERRVALARAHGPDEMTWAAAAAEAGLPAAIGEKVRRKLPRLGERLTQRTAAIGKVAARLDATGTTR